MSSKGFLAIPRALLQDHNWLSFSLIEEKIFMTIYQNCCWEDREMDDHGVIIKLKPLQLLTTVRDLAKLCRHSECNKSKIERAKSKFILIGFLRQEVRHTKTILTITEKHICEMSETRFETKVRQDLPKKWDTNEEDVLKNIRTIKENEENEQKKSSNVVSVSFFSSYEDERIETILRYSESKNLAFSETALRRWVRAHGIDYVEEIAGGMFRKKTATKNPEGWMEMVLVENKKIANNKKFIEDFKIEKQWTEMTITKQYCREEFTGKDFYYKNHTCEEFARMIELLFEQKKEQNESHKI